MPGSRSSLSIVVAAWNSPASLERALSSLRAQAEGVEVVVASNLGPGTAPAVSSGLPSARLVERPTDATVPELRTAGIDCATGQIVALTEDHVVFDDAWCSRILAAHDQPYDVVGGAVENARGASPLDWAVYFYDYGQYMLPGCAGEAAALTGLNVSYKRAALDRVAEVFRAGFVETRVHEALRESGSRLYFAPDALVYHVKRYGSREALAQAFHLGRSFGGSRFQASRWLARAAYAVGTAALPVVLTLRAARSVARNGRNGRELLASLPYLVALEAAWSAGEFCGYCFGEGQSGRRWR